MFCFSYFLQKNEKGFYDLWVSGNSNCEIDIYLFGFQEKF